MTSTGRDTVTTASGITNSPINQPATVSVTSNLSNPGNPLQTQPTTGTSTTTGIKIREYMQTGQQAYARVEKLNAELFTLTYGSIVAQLLKDYEDVEEVNGQLEKMGYNIGLRLIDEFLARSGLARCSKDIKEVAEIIAKVGFKMFLNVTAAVANWSADEKEFSLLLEENPLTEFVELPENCANLQYCNILCGVIRGALEMVQIKVETKLIRCVLKGDDFTEIRVSFKAFMSDEIPQDAD